MSSVNRKPHISNLADDMLPQILKYLSPSERKVAMLTCHSWYRAANNNLFMKNKFIYVNLKSYAKGEMYRENDDPPTISINFGNSIHSYTIKWMTMLYNYMFPKSVVSSISIKDNREIDNPLAVFSKSSINFSNYLIDSMLMLDLTQDFWIQLGKNIKTLKIRNCYLAKYDVVNILQSCENLELLSFENCKFMWKSNISELMTDNDSNCEVPNLKCLELSFCRMSNAIFYTLVRNCPAIQKIGLNECYLNNTLNISDEYDVYSDDPNSFQMPLDAKSPFYTQCSVRFVMTFIKARSDRIKHLYYNQLLVKNHSVLNYLNDCVDLSLLSLHMNNASGTDHNFLKRQTQLKVLRFGDCFEISDELLLDICRNLVNLEHLDMCCYDITDFGIAELYRLSKLRSLHLPSGIVSNEGMKRGLCRKMNYSLEKLHIPSSLNIREDFVIMMAENFPNLRYLDISDCNEAITETSLFEIFKHQTQLEVLIMKESKKICNLGEYHKEKDNPSQLDLSCLKRLKQLHLDDCSNITDESIQRSLRLPRLINFSFYRSDNVTTENMKSIVKNCPNIKYLNLGSCTNVTNETVVLIVTSLKNLKHLFVDHTSVSVEGIKRIMKSMNINPTEVTKYLECIHTS